MRTTGKVFLAVGVVGVIISVIFPEGQMNILAGGMMVAALGYGGYIGYKRYGSGSTGRSRKIEKIENLNQKVDEDPDSVTEEELKEVTGYLDGEDEYIRAYVVKIMTIGVSYEGTSEEYERRVSSVLEDLNRRLLDGGGGVSDEALTAAYIMTIHISKNTQAMEMKEREVINTYTQKLIDNHSGGIGGIVDDVIDLVTSMDVRVHPASDEIRPDPRDSIHYTAVNTLVLIAVKYPEEASGTYAEGEIGRTARGFQNMLGTPSQEREPLIKCAGAFGLEMLSEEHTEETRMASENLIEYIEHDTEDVSELTYTLEPCMGALSSIANEHETTEVEQLNEGMIRLLGELRQLNRDHGGDNIVIPWMNMCSSGLMILYLIYKKSPELGRGHVDDILPFLLPGTDAPIMARDRKTAMYALDQVLGEHPGEMVGHIEEIGGLMQDEDEDIRRFAAGVLNMAASEHPDEVTPSVEGKLRRATDHSDEDVRTAAAMALNDLGYDG